MRFQVPQFIEVEDKIFGPLTLKQFIYLAGSAGVIGMLWVWLPFFWVIVIGGPIAALGAALAFLKINERPFPLILESMVGYVTSNHLYLWKQRTRTPEATKLKAVEPELDVPGISANKLKDLAWDLDTKEGIYAGRIQSEKTIDLAKEKRQNDENTMINLGS